VTAAAERGVPVLDHRVRQGESWAEALVLGLLGGSSPWWLLAAVVPAAILVGNLVMPGRLERRAEELRDPEVGGP
jgi:hypothetical protein